MNNAVKAIRPPSKPELLKVVEWMELHSETCLRFAASWLRKKYLSE